MAAVKKKAAKKKVAKKKAAVKKTVKKKIAREFHVDPKLGHDPLAWMSADEGDAVSGSNIVVEPEILEEPGEASEAEVVEHVESTVDETVAETLVVELDETPEQMSVEDAQSDELSNDEEKTMLNLPDIFGIAQTEVMYEEINKQLASVDEIQIDASAVETVDAAALQLLISLFNECKSQGKKISWHSQSDKINESARLLNLSGTLGL